MKIELLLQRIKDINNKYDQFAKLTGEHFNVFSVLGLSSAENSHSLFIAELLNPQGSHGQQDLYLNLFFKQFDLINDHYIDTTAKITTEKYIGEINKDYDQGGRIDILIEYPAHPEKNIIIENKIYARDQYLQLHRYAQAYKDARIVYLTLDGAEPTSESLGNLEPDDIICISYREHILKWLDECIEKSSSLPIIRETLIQYRTLIKQLTNQCSNKGKEMEISNIILDSEENFNAAKQIANAVNSMDRIHDVLLDFMRSKFKNKYGTDFIKICLFKEYSINLQLTYADQGKAFQIGVVPLLNNVWPWKAKFNWKNIEEANIIHKLLCEHITNESGKDIKSTIGYESGQNYICRIPFGSLGTQSYLFHKPEITFADYKWLSNPENQEEIAEYALKLCNEIIQFLRDNIKNPEVKFLI
ncbi:MAG: hypothetical protein EKK57_07990 [Proteobacteria bacterium]|nr:MAG: hypothetical protein EKK57_07990 [Pseudomonadota bacterium]